ncbi:MAG: DUF2267 domain-containing protein [Chloroflexi bacterium]|nr:MAG: DUF2267 domain-containing protein [Chloroflexota bacterium]
MTTATFTNENAELMALYAQIQQEGNLRTVEHARRWCQGVLRTLGYNLDGRTKRKLSKALPEEMAAALNNSFKIFPFRDMTISQQEFLKEVARRSGHTDANFARFPTTAVFRHIKKIIPNELNQQVARTLPPEVSKLWEQA